MSNKDQKEDSAHDAADQESTVAPSSAAPTTSGHSSSWSYILPSAASSAYGLPSAAGSGYELPSAASSESSYVLPSIASGHVLPSVASSTHSSCTHAYIVVPMLPSILHALHAPTTCGPAGASDESEPEVMDVDTPTASSPAGANDGADESELQEQMAMAGGAVGANDGADESELQEPEFETEFEPECELVSASTVHVDTPLNDLGLLRQYRKICNILGGLHMPIEEYIARFGMWSDENPFGDRIAAGIGALFERYRHAHLIARNDDGELVMGWFLAPNPFSCLNAQLPADHPSMIPWSGTWYPAVFGAIPWQCTVHDSLLPMACFAILLNDGRIWWVHTTRCVFWRWSPLP